jgi:hypothetical protein
MKMMITFAVPKTEGSIAQLVQSICLTSRGSAVRTRVLPHNSLALRGYSILYHLRLLLLSTVQCIP